MPAAEKLVRDRLDDRIPADRLRIETDPDRIMTMLSDKLDEEIAELRDGGFSDPAEFGDVIEVLRAIAARKGMDWTILETIRLDKLDQRGGFERGLVYRLE